MAQGFKLARFIKTAVAFKDFPLLRNISGEVAQEVALIGRSNVGKSSLLNHLLNTKALAKTSATPGKTQALNFFYIDEQITFVDLPGYGYAKVPDSVRKKWGPMIQDYLQKRESLNLILFLFDIRRLPNEEDQRLLEWMLSYEKKVILVLTKVDKVGAGEKVRNTAKILQTFSCLDLAYIHYSSTKNEGRVELTGMIRKVLKECKFFLSRDENEID